MPKFKVGKLVRDKIVDHQLASGSKTIYRQLTEEEHKRELVNKIIEEAREIAQAKPDEVADEIADVQQAIDDLKEKYSLTDRDIARAQAKKNNKNGAFKKGLFVEQIEMNEDDQWVEYYRNNSDRYPEID